MKKQVFLGGACGTTTWRRDVAIPALQAAGVGYHDPQLPPGAWTEADEVADMQAKAAADVLLFVIGGESRAVASIAEAAYLLAAGRPLALALCDVPPGAIIDGVAISEAERADLNRGRLFLRSMAAAHGVPVFGSVAEAVDHAIALCGRAGPLTLPQVAALLDEIDFPGHRFLAEAAADGFLLHIERTEEDVDTGRPALQVGRRFHLPADATAADVVRAALQAALAWSEHSARERFRYRGERVYGPHQDADQLVALCRSAQRPGHRRP